jgi:hypothetical protein
MSDLKILTVDESTGRITPGLPSPPEEISGIELLVQIVALLYLTNGGRSIVTPDRVGGLRRFLGGNVNLEDPAEFFADVRMMTSQIEQQIKKEQVATKRPPSERLQELQLIDIIPNEEESSVEIRVAVINEEQQQQQAVVTVI